MAWLWETGDVVDLDHAPFLVDCAEDPGPAGPQPS
jgi:hypothetical protein